MSAYEIMCEVRLENIEVFADIGALDKEIGTLQPLKIHVALNVALPERDLLEQTFDYTKIRRLAQDLAATRTVLIETFAARLAEMCLENDVVHAADIAVEKPWAVRGCLASVRVKLKKEDLPRPAPEGGDRCMCEAESPPGTHNHHG